MTVEIDVRRLDKSDPVLNRRGVELVNEALMIAYGSRVKANAIVNPYNPDDVENQGRLYESPHGQRLGAFVTDRMVGIMTLGEWYRGDQAPFAKYPWEKAGVALQKARGIPHAIGRPFAIHTLEVDRDIDLIDQEEVLAMLLANALNAADHREIRISVPDGDPAAALMPVFGFIATNRYGERPGVPGILQRLYRRKSD